jgi:hypothetical protein
MNLTLGFIVAMVVIIAIFDVWVIAKKGKQESISAHLIRISHKHPSIPFLLGFLCGHLFWRMSDLSVYGELIK